MLDFDCLVYGYQAIKNPPCLSQLYLFKVLIANSVCVIVCFFHFVLIEQIQGSTAKA